MVDELGQQIERTEAEVELLRSQTKKKKPTSGSDGRSSELEALNDRRRWHIGKLELIMRLLENGQISPERVGEVKDDIQYYVESNVVRLLRSNTQAEREIFNAMSLPAGRRLHRR